MKLQVLFTLILLLSIKIQSQTQIDSSQTGLSYELDFRFRAEHDWDSRKSNGSFRADRSRLRYRLRTGATYNKEWYSLGFRIRTGQQNKQQDPQLTLGRGFKEFGTLPLGFEKIYFQGTYKNLKFWLGKNDYSFIKNNELFWSDNVFPEGIYLEQDFNLDLESIVKISVKGGHYILSSNGKSFLKDAYFQGIQTSIYFDNPKLVIFPSFYLLRNIPNVPDGYPSFNIDYSIFHFGSKLQLLKSNKLLVDFDIYHNLNNYQSNDNVPNDFKDQKTGYSVGIQYGTLRKAKDYKVKITYTVLQRYAALDYMAQNDWARWDYSEFNSPDGRLTNLKGIELVAGVSISKKANLIAKYYLVNQLIETGLFKETGQRIRFDLNVKL